MPNLPHVLESRVEVAVHLLVVGQGWHVPHLTLSIQGLLKLQLEALVFLVQDPQTVPVLLKLHGESRDGAL